MLEAKSMYFGGEIINASECDYQTSREFGLVCPFCSSAVFIRSESIREARGRIQLVKPYFAHYPSGWEDNWDCDKRSRSKAGREEIEQLKIQARNQRLALYSRHLWQMIAESHGITQQQLNRARSLFGENWCESASILARRGFRLAQSDAYTFIDAAVEDIKRQAHKDYFLLECDLRLHKAICYEVADFLGTNTGGFVFLKLFKASLYQQLMAKAEGWGVSQIKRVSPIAHVSSISILIGATNWIEQINKRITDEPKRPDFESISKPL